MNFPCLPQPMFTFEDLLCGIEMLGYAKVYRRLYENSKSVLAVSVLTAERQTLINRKFSNEAEQQQWLERFNAAIRECGVPDNLILIPGGSFIQAGLIKYVKPSSVGLGHTIELYDHVPPKGSRDPKDKPLVTALFESKEAAIEFFNYLAARLNEAQ